MKRCLCFCQCVSNAWHDIFTVNDVFTNEFFDDMISANFIHFKYMLT
jgi:hypothetical protein